MEWAIVSPRIDLNSCVFQARALELPHVSTLEQSGHAIYQRIWEYQLANEPPEIFVCRLDEFQFCSIFIEKVDAKNPGSTSDDHIADVHCAPYESPNIKLLQFLRLVFGAIMVFVLLSFQFISGRLNRLLWLYVVQSSWHSQDILQLTLWKTFYMIS